MSGRSRNVAVAAIAVITLVTSGCGSSSRSIGTRSTTATPARVTGTLNVFAAASLTAPFSDAKTKLTAANSRLHLTYNFAGSNGLVTQIKQGAPADVFASADTKNMQALVDAGLVETPRTFARNTLQIAVAAGNPKRIASLADLAKPDVTVVLEAQGVPAGDYTRQLLAAKHINVNPRSLETDVKSALAKVTSGEADATVVYVTDVKAGGPKVQGVSIPDADQPSITYPIAVVKAAKNHAGAQAFVDSAVSGDIQKALEAAGFSTPQ